MTMQAAVRQFNAEVELFARSNVPKEVRTLHRKLHLEALRRIVLRTPVKTGRAKGNWVSSIGQPSQDVDYDRTGEQASIEDGLSVVAAIQPYSLSFITNNLPYIEPLENGSSKQAPTGMVATTVAELGGAL